MMAGTGDDREDFKGLKGDAGLSLDQDLQQQVSGGSKGNDNVCGDVGGSYVFVGEGTGCDLVGDVDVQNEGVVVGIGGNDGGLLAETGKCGILHGELLVESEGVGVVEGAEADCEVVVGVEGNDCEVKVEDHDCEKDESGAGVENVEVVVGVGGNDQDYTVEEDNCELLVMTEKKVVLHGELLVESGSVGVVEGGEADCEAKVEDQVGLKDGSGVGVEKGEVVAGIGANDCEVKVESQVRNKDESGAGLISGEVVVEVEGDDCEVKVKDQVGLNDKTVVKVKNGEVDVGDGRNDRDYVAEEDNCVAHELKQYHELKQINDLANDAELGESKETGIKSEKVSDLCDILVRPVQEGVIVSNKDIENSSKANSTMNSVGSESYADINLESGIHSHSYMPAKYATLAESKVLSGSVNGGHATLQEYSSGDFVNGETLVVAAKANPFQFLIKVPRFDDDKLRERIKDAQLLVEEKTTRRYDIRIEIEMKRAKLQSIFNKFEATKSDERTARRSVKLKRQEIDFIQDRINKMKNSISVMDINSRIMHMEYMVEHETNPLKEEKHLLSEISILRKLRDQISSNVYSENEDNLPFDQIVLMEMQLQTLKKELGDLKAKVSNTEGVAILLRQEYSGECKKLREFQAQFKAANDVRQDAYQYYLSLERQMHEKSKHYFIYKDEVKEANNYALNGDREALSQLCTNQVETFMDLWNKNDEFRREYVRCNKESTMRRFKTPDGRSLGPNEEARTTSPSPPTKKPVKREQVDGESWLVAEPRKKMSKDKTSVGAIPESGSLSDIVSGRLESLKTSEEKNQQKDEERESARVAELRQEEVAKMKEKLRQEERAKAQEALERKRRNAEKAQMRAMLRAQKEAEQKEKEKEKRLRKKEKKNADGESGAELQTNSTMKLEDSTDIPGTKLKKSSQSNRYTKSKAAAIPPPLRNKSRRQILNEIMCWILVLVGVVLMFMVMTDSSYRTVKPRTKGDSFPGNHWQPF